MWLDALNLSDIVISQETAKKQTVVASATNVARRDMKGLTARRTFSVSYARGYKKNQGLLVI